MKRAQPAVKGLRARVCWLVVLALAIPAAGHAANEPPPVGFSLIPKAFQRRPQLDFNLLTEMTDEGRKLTPPTPGNPVYYIQQAGAWVSTGSAPAGKGNPPSAADMELAMQKALGAAGYLPAALPERPPTLAIIFTYGTHATDPEVPPDLEFARDMQAQAANPGESVPFAPTPSVRPSSAEELLPIVLNNGTLYNDLLERAALVAGPKFAAEFKQALAKEVDNINLNVALPGAMAPVSPDARSPYQMFVSKNPMVAYLVETAFHTVYFVVASAYDYPAMLKGEKRLMWRTKMTVDAQGVALKESLLPMIASAAPYLGKDMSEVNVVSQRISRQGKVEIGEATVVEADVRRPTPAPAPASPPPKSGP